MIRLSKARGFVKYEPPVEVKCFFGPIDTSESIEKQIECLLWIPATLVARFRYQFPHLYHEADELFSIGMLTVCKTVTEGTFSGEEIGAVCTVRCKRAMEDFANNVHSTVKVCTTTRYENRKRGIETPTSCAFTHQNSGSLSINDDRTNLYIRDAAESLGLDLDNLTRQDKLKLAKVLDA